MARSPTTKANKEANATENSERSTTGAEGSFDQPRLLDEPDSRWCRSTLLQGWISIAAWMIFGLLLEGLLGYKTPAYLLDNERRELFRLAHTHGTFFGLVLIAAALSVARVRVSPPRAALTALRVGALVMPLAFLLAGIWHYESDPGLAIWLVPPAALSLIFGAVAFAIASLSGLRRKD